VPVHKTECLDCANAQFLLIGEGENTVRRAFQPTDKDKEGGKETTEKDLEKLEDED
jgi:hypothetical protein